MHTLTTSFVLGYHGCDHSVAEKLLNGEQFAFSENDHDWLGSGIYFWQANPQRGLDWARHLKEKRHGDISAPAVVGAVIDLGYCLDLISANGIAAVRGAYKSFVGISEKAGFRLPSNSLGNDLLLRKLDCAVINHLHETVKKTKQKPFDSVRGVFLEGDRIYENSGFFELSHIQLCVRNSEAIKGVFRVKDSELH